MLNPKEIAIINRIYPAVPMDTLLRAADMDLYGLLVDIDTLMGAKLNDREYTPSIEVMTTLHDHYWRWSHPYDVQSLIGLLLQVAKIRLSDAHILIDPDAFYSLDDKEWMVENGYGEFYGGFYDNNFNAFTDFELILEVAPQSHHVASAMFKEMLGCDFDNLYRHWFG